MTNYEVEFYQKENGEEPAKDFLLSLDAKMRAKMLRIIDLLEVNGPMVHMPYSEAIGNGLFEIRTKQGTDISRVLYFFAAGKKIILTNGFVKKTQRIPVREINLAQVYRRDYERRN